MSSATATSRKALSLAFLGVLAFSVTMPATVLALDGLDPYLIGIGRAAAAAVLAAVALLLGKARRPTSWTGLITVGVGVILGFPILSTLALDQGVSPSHAAVVIGLLPAATAITAVLRAGERPTRAFWSAATSGAACVTIFTFAQGGGSFTTADLLLVGALLLAALGYAEGGRLARTMPAWQVICWSLVLFVPISLPATVYLLAATDPTWTAKSMSGFAYLSAVSMFLGFFAWYAGLARAGIARASQIQLAQPVLTLVWSALFLNDHVGLSTALAAAAVLLCVAWTQRTRAPRPIPETGPEYAKIG